MIRAAEDKDFETVKNFVPGLIRDSEFGKFFQGYELTEFMYKQYTSQPKEKFCLIIESDKPVGFAMFDYLTWPFIDKEVKFARMPFIYIEPEYRAKGFMDDVLSAFERWAKLIGAAYATVGTKQKKKHGYKKAEIVYLKEIK